MKKFTAVLTAFILLALALPFSSSGKSTDIDNKYVFFKDENCHSYCGLIKADGSSDYDHYYQTSDFITVNAGDIVYAGPMKSDQPLYITTYDSGKKIKSQVTALSGLTLHENLEGGVSIRKYTVPAGVSYVRVTLDSEYYNTFVVTVNKAFSASEYNAWIDAQGLRKYIDFINADKSKFSGTTIKWCGDSMGNGSYEQQYEGGAKGDNNHSWAARVANILKMDGYINKSTGGTTVSSKHSSRLLSKIEAVADADTKYLVIEGGMVDMFAYQDKVVPIGYLSDSYDPSTFAGEETFIGGLERCFYAATTKAPNAVIVFAICYSATQSMAGRWGWERIWQYVQPVADKWGIPVIDMFNNETINYYLDMDRSDGGYMFVDNLHCAPHAYTVSAMEVAMELYSIGKYDLANRKAPSVIPERIAKATWKVPDAGSTPVTISFAQNVYQKLNLTKGYPQAKDGLISTNGDTQADLYRTSAQYIEVTPGDTVTFGPCSIYQPCLIMGYDSSKKQITGMVDSLGVDVVAFFTSGYMAYSYVVPDGVKYVRIAFPKTQSPVITINYEYTEKEYIDWLSKALKGETITVTTAAVTTKAPETTKTPVTTKSPETTKTPVTTKSPETTKTPVTTQVPTTTVTPVTTQTPVTTNAPVSTSTPVTTQTPVTTAEVTTSAEITTADVTKKAEVTTFADATTDAITTTEATTAEITTAAQPGTSALDTSSPDEATSSPDETQVNAETSAPAETTEASTESGCASSVGATGLILLIVITTAVYIKKRA